jgi:hypothetical protein
MPHQAPGSSTKGLSENLGFLGQKLAISLSESWVFEGIWALLPPSVDPAVVILSGKMSTIRSQDSVERGLVNVAAKAFSPKVKTE